MNSLEVGRYKELNELEIFLKPISLDDRVLRNYSIILLYYPLKESKRRIYLTLNKKQRVGMLNRHILGVASKIGVYNSLIEEVVKLKGNYRTYTKYSVDNEKIFSDTKFWKKRLKETKLLLNSQYILLLKIMSEEIIRQQNVKYLRNKKITNILQKEQI